MGCGLGNLSEQEREGHINNLGHRPSSQQGVDVMWPWLQ